MKYYMHIETQEVFALEPDHPVAVGLPTPVEEYVELTELEVKQLLDQQEQVRRQCPEYMRHVRDTLLTQLDKVVANPLRFASLTPTEKTELAQYRQALLDLPEQPKFPYSVELPTKPSFI